MNLPGFHAFRRTLTAIALLVLLGRAAPALPQEAPRADGPPYRVSGDVTRPEILSSTRPIYTEIARRSRVTGTVIVEAVIDEQGNVTDTRVLKGLPMGLSEAAVEAIKSWVFKPATLKGRPVPVYYVLTVNFQIDGESPEYGPMFGKFLQENPEFAEHLRGKRYQEASELLDRWAAERPSDAGIPLARIYLLLEQGRPQEALQQALDAQGPERYESLCRVGIYAWTQTLDKDLDAESRAKAIELGLQAETAAMATQADGVKAMIYKSWLLRKKTGLMLDTAERQALIAESDRLWKQVEELQKGQGPGTAPAPETRQDRPF
jgi:TonB family protein